MHPVRLVVRDDLDRRRLTVLFRLVLALPHLVWAVALRDGAFVARLRRLAVVLVERRAAGSLHRFLANYTRYTVHLTAYLCLAADPYPGFTRRRPYPVDVEIDPPAPQRRLGAPFRLVLAIPALVLSSALGRLDGPRRASAPRCWPARGLGSPSRARLVRLPRPRTDAARDARRRGVRDRLRRADDGVRAPPHRSVPRRDARPRRPAPELPAPRSRSGSTTTSAARACSSSSGCRCASPPPLADALVGVRGSPPLLLAWVVALVIGRVPRPLHRFLAAYVRAWTHLIAFLYARRTSVPRVRRPRGQRTRST